MIYEALVLAYVFVGIGVLIGCDIGEPRLSPVKRALSATFWPVFALMLFGVKIATSKSE